MGWCVLYETLDHTKNDVDVYFSVKIFFASFDNSDSFFVYLNAIPMIDNGTSR